MPLIASLDELVPEAGLKCRVFLDSCKERNFPVIINETRRELITQLLYFLQGRIDVDKANKDILQEFNRLRKKLGFWELGSHDILERRITWTLESNHENGRAFDAVPMLNGKAHWAAPYQTWLTMGEIGESAGLKWGGRWKERDLPHFEL